MATATVRGENGEFCITVVPVTRSVGILIQLFNAFAARVINGTSSHAKDVAFYVESF